MARIHRVDPSRPGITRVRSGRGFSFRNADGTAIHDAETRARMADLVIPPAWQEVWISPDPDGHLQVTGLDAAGRRQYIYHERWRMSRDRRKFQRMADVAEHLPEMRRQARVDLARPGMPLERALACAVLLIDRGLFRVGSEQYARENGTYGVATLLKRHVSLDGDALSFDYPAKHAKRRITRIIDPDLAAVVGTLQRRRGGTDELLAWHGSDGAWHDVDSGQVNAYIKQIAGDAAVTAKDFRTWHATVLAAIGCATVAAASDLTDEGPPTPRTTRDRIANVVKEVSHYLGNTPAVCRASYIDPRVFDRFRAGHTIAPALERLDGFDDLELTSSQLVIESAVVDLLGGAADRTIDRNAASYARQLIEVS